VYLVSFLAKDATSLVHEVVDYGVQSLDKAMNQTKTTPTTKQNNSIEEDINKTLEKYQQTLNTIITNSSNTLTTLCNTVNDATCENVMKAIQNITEQINTSK